MRLNNWPKLLDDAINAARSKPFVWGSHDCCLFAADAAKAITGVDAASSLRGTYSTEAEAKAIIDAAGGFNKLINQIAASHGWVQCSAASARRGDLVQYEAEDGTPSLGVCVGGNCAFAGKNGVSFVRLSKCSSSWRVD